MGSVLFAGRLGMKWDPAAALVFGPRGSIVIDGPPGGNASHDIDRACPWACAALGIESGSGELWMVIDEIGPIEAGNEALLDDREQAGTDSQHDGTTSRTTVVRSGAKRSGSPVECHHPFSPS